MKARSEKVFSSLAGKLDRKSAEYKWASKFALAEAGRSKKYIAQIAPESWTDRDIERYANRAQTAYNEQWRDITRHKRAMKEYMLQHKLRMCATEDNLIEALDWVRDCERTGLNQPYGTATQLNPGDKVIVAIQGHALQGRQGYIERQRGSQYLVVVETSKGTVRAFLNLQDLILVKANKFGGV